jgi:hypothetical protein
MLFGVRFDSGGSLTVLEVEIPAKTLVKPHNHPREDETICNGWIEDLERT